GLPRAAARVVRKIRAGQAAPEEQRRDQRRGAEPPAHEAERRQRSARESVSSPSEGCQHTHSVASYSQARLPSTNRKAARETDAFSGTHSAGGGVFHRGGIAATLRGFLIGADSASAQRRAPGRAHGFG